MQYVDANGAQMPALGFGTFELSSDDAKAMVDTALKTGYRHIDTAQVYKNEAAVGAAITDSDVAREDIFLTTKVWTDHFHGGDLQASVKDSLNKLETDYVDLLLLHWPNPDVELEETIRALNDTVDQGMARYIGISNFTTSHIDQAVAASKHPLATNQVEYHPFLNQTPVRDTLGRHNMALTAYCPLAKGKVFGNDTLTAIGQRHSKNGGQVALRWLLQHGDVIAIPRSSNPQHVANNFDIFDFELSETEMSQITDLHTPDGRLINPSFAPDWDNAA
ncbi:aldo/keto reductase [Salinisphaera sp. USBA-960]|uniref:aldo/keto reductase n=1 Tax=Salinisphaera orenii TaxID=856731 RepID=UPI000DBE7BF7|nr:aldo/keto reductase [Salifodinibacter halophilus]NNC26642.1 aldo/keto reductase [Salifodinibacter halophilus]